MWFHDFATAAVNKAFPSRRIVANTILRAYAWGVDNCAMTTSPNWRLRRIVWDVRRIIWDDGTPSTDPEDYEIVDERRERIGRLSRIIAVGGGEVWRWKVYGIADDIPPAGQAPTREAAMAAFKAAWATCRPRERGG
jgi:hypothetical protein